jgi:hypothetical protein
VTINVADAAESRDDLLADVAAFGRADGIRFKPGLGWECVGPDVDTPKGKTTRDSKWFPIGKKRGSGSPA